MKNMKKNVNYIHGSLGYSLGIARRSSVAHGPARQGILNLYSWRGEVLARTGDAMFGPVWNGQAR